ncbi:MFS transporter [Kitasatospora purpeofusca]|uniref:MFS transporter n=1 Tax=Kitasatospora purpeofusca TaxID=67352 RepID=UPI0035E02B59
MPSAPRSGLLRNPDFGRLLAATAAGQLGDRIMFLALPLAAVAALDGDPVLRATVLGDAFFNLFLAAYQAMLLVLLPREMGLDSTGIGFVLSGMGCGALVGALCAGRLSVRFGPGPVSWLAPLVTCPPAVLMPLAHPGWTVPTAAAGLATLSLGGVVRVVAQSSVQQALTPVGMLGRMSATTRFLSGCGLPLGGILGGAAGAALGTRATLWIGAVGMTLSFVPSLASPLRSLRSEPPA